MRGRCPSCGELLRLRSDTGRCVRCSRTCVECSQVLRFKASIRCRACRLRVKAAAAKSVCARCGRLGYIRAETGWCGSCSRRPAPALPARPCLSCGELRRKKGDGLCNRCWARSPSRPITQAENLLATLDHPPRWLIGFAEFAVGRYCVERACVLVSSLGRLLRNEGSLQPQLLLERARRPGRSAGALARTLEEFLVAEGLAFGLDQEARLAHGRRQRRVEAAPAGLRPAVASFADHLARSNERARHAGTKPRADATIEQTLGIVRDLASFVVVERAKQDWSAVEVADVEAFLAQRPANRRRRLQAMRQFFRWARKNKLVLVNPTRDLPVMSRRRFTGRTLSLADQRRLFRRWSEGAGVHPNEALAGVLAMLHAASNSELRHLCLDDIDRAGRTIRLGRRPRPVPLDPVTMAALERCLDHRMSLATCNPHVVVTKTTRTRSTPASTAYVTHVLDAAGVSPKLLRSTRIVDLVISLDPKVASEALGMNAGGLVDYLADHVDQGHLALEA